MPRNVEIKARIESVASMSSRVAAIATEGPFRSAQDDTFFCCDHGRLKLRAFSDDSGELIFYRRADQLGPKESFYVRSPTHVPSALRDALALAYGIVGRVIKVRALYLVGRTRVHLDSVDGLGDFLELEVVLADGEEAAAGVVEARDLMVRLGVAQSDLIEDAYVALLNATSK